MSGVAMAMEKAGEGKFIEKLTMLLPKLEKGLVAIKRRT